MLTSSIRASAAALCIISSACATSDAEREAPPTLEVMGATEAFAPGVVTTRHSELRLTLSPDGGAALWFSRNRPGAAGGYDIWMSRREGDAWSAPTPVSFNTSHRELDPAFTADRAYVYLCSDRPGGVGGDDIYRARVTADGFGEAEHLGPEVNSAGNEWAPNTRDTYAPMLDWSQPNRISFSSRRADDHDMDVYLVRYRIAR